MDRTLTILDTTGIQDYIFGSNRLRENVVASQLVELATSDWVYEALPTPNNLAADKTVIPGWRLEDDDQRQAELIYRGGGNVVLLFRSLDAAKATVGRLSQVLLTRAPGLSLVAAHATFTWTNDALGTPDGVYYQVVQQLAQEKQRRRSTVGMPSQSVALACRSTGLPAVASDPEEPTRPISAVVAAKVDRTRRNQADERLKDLLREANVSETIDTYELSRDLDELGRSKGEQSYIALVHADANGMGQRFQALLSAYPGANRNRRCINDLRALSESLNQASLRALKATVRALMAALKQAHFQDFCAGLPRKRLPSGSDGKPYLPFRPLVFGGDDVTFVCDGRLGLTLAALYLQEFTNAARKLADGQPAHACAGVAIVKTHYPFARAYALCDELCSSAKTHVRNTGGVGAALDWYFATTGIRADLDTLRTRDYTVHAGSLHQRPTLLQGSGWRTWDNFDRTVQTLLYDEQWRERRNKVLALREALRGGAQTTERFRVMYGVAALPLLDAVADTRYRETGWIEACCAYFDAVEALDCYLPLALRPPQAQGEGTP